MKKKKKKARRKGWLERRWRRFREKCRSGQCRVGIPITFSKRISQKSINWRGKR